MTQQLQELQAKYNDLREKLKFLYYWALRSDENIRDIISKIGGIEGGVAHNDEIFDYKWRKLGKGYASLENPEHLANIKDIVVKWTGLATEWFKGKHVLDAGCGDGRLSYGLCKLGAHVTSIDKTSTGVECTAKYCQEFSTHQALVQDILETWDEKSNSFDLVLSFGVVHCTGDTQRAISNLGALVKLGGYFSLMVYGYPRLDKPGDFSHLVRKERIRQAIRHLDFDDAYEYILREVNDEMAVRGWFDATTPRVEDHYTFPQVAMMMKQAGFTEIIHLHPEMRNICVRGKMLKKNS